MQKIYVGVAFFLGLGAICFGVFFNFTPKSAPPPNVVFILIDTLRADRIHAERGGIAVMPNLASYAKEGADFEHALAMCSWTRPSMAALFTGAYVDTHQVYYSVENEDLSNPKSDLLSEKWLTLPEWLRDNGYDNFAFVTNPNLAYPLGFGQGFQPERYLLGGGARADEVTHRTLKEMDTLKPPFFMYLHYMDPHVPYDPPKAELEVFGALPDISEGDEGAFERFKEYYMECVSISLGLQAERSIPDLSPQGKERVRQLYDLECHFADKQIGRLVETVRMRNPDTLFVITADHGEQFWEHGGMGHGTTLYEEEVHVPLIVFGPRVKARKIERTTELVGLCPTLAYYLKLPEVSTWQGRNWFAPKTTTTQPAFARSLGFWESLKVDVEAVWEGKLKLIRNNSKQLDELYDLERDPRELENIANVEVETVTVQLNKLAEHKKANIQSRGNISRIQGSMDEETLEHLRQLGYVGDIDGKK